VAKNTVVSSPPIWVWLIAPILPIVAVMAAAVLPHVVPPPQHLS
jgi:hypothetical protein